MELFDVIEKRASVRRYQPKPLENEKLQRILGAMRRAPSAVNRQKWIFCAAVSPEIKAQIAQATSFDWVNNAGAIIAVCGTDCGMMTNSHRSDTVDLSIALTFGMLAAEDLGLGSCWIAHYEEPALRAILGLPEECSVASILTVGYPDESPAPRARKPLEDIVRIL